ncbi:unnamed protein product [Rhizophagus irregularis]|uniref:Uncharacterized protein n=1 Tax=Rhizophagus irregularis TaxID=588596 RepID=A0A915ZMS0_9GLOM|nr:unnamed protein product [Rhizophagus irregularis]
MRGSYVVETRAICLAFFLQKKMHKILPQNSRNLILLIQSRNIRILLTLPSEIEDSHALYHTYKIYSKFAGFSERFLVKPERFLDSRNFFGYGILYFREILLVPEYIQDFFYTIQLQSRSEIYYFIKTSNRTSIN